MITQFLTVFAFLLLGCGIALAIAFLVGSKRPKGPTSPIELWLSAFWRGPGRTAAERRTHQTLLLVAIVAGALTWIFTGWPLGGIIITVAIPGLPWLFSSATAEKKAVARLAALEAWTRRISDYVRNGIGLQAAIIATARTAPPLIDTEVRTLAARLHAGTDPSAALRAFADELDDYTCDEVVAPLILQLADAGEGLHAALSDIAQALSEEVNARAMADTERAQARFTVRFITGFTIALLAVGALNVKYAAPYQSVLGQTILFLLAVIYIVLMLWIRSLSLPPRVPRLLRPESDRATSTELLAVNR